MSRSNFLWAFRLCIALFISAVLPVDTAQSLTYAQVKKKNPAQASKYAKRGSAKAKKKDYRGALSDFKNALSIFTDIEL